MKKNGIKKIIGMIIALSVVFGVVAGSAAIVKASQNAEAAKVAEQGTEIKSYDFVILEEEEVPGAAMPTPLESSAPHAIWVMVLMLIGVLLIGYELWFENLQSRAQVLAQEGYNNTACLNEINRLHPFKAMDAKKEMELRAAEYYFR